MSSDQQSAPSPDGADPAAAYGDRHAAVYDRIYGARFAPDAAVDILARLGRDGGVLELGVGTGRLAIPLAARGIRVDGIEGSAVMVEQLRSHAGAEQVGVVIADLADFALEHRGYAVAVCAVSTLFMLTPDAQRTCVAAAARHLRPGGLLLIEAFRPDPSRFDAHGDRIEDRDSHTVHSHHDPRRQIITVTHILDGDIGGAYEVTLHYRTVHQLDELAASAGLHLAFRWSDWTGTPVAADSRDPISGYRLDFD